MSRFVLALDASQISEYLNCPRSWHFRYNLNLVRAGRKTKALDKGTIIHQLCDFYYNLRAMAPAESHLKHCTAVIELLKTQKTNLSLTKEEMQFLQMRFFQYAVRYSNGDIRPKTKSGVPAVELGFSKVLLSTPEKLYVVEGRIDMIGTYAGVEMFMDHKTQAQAKDIYKFCPQFLTYSWATGLLRGMINYIGLQAEMSDKTFRRELITFPAWKIKEWEAKMLQVFHDIETDLSTPDWLETSPYAMDQHACGGAFNSSPCMFTQLCETGDLRMREQMKKQNYEIKVWRPWEFQNNDNEEVA